MHQQDLPFGVGVVPSFARGLPLTLAAIHFASLVHRGRCRESDHAPFIIHPLEVAAMLRSSGAPDAVVAAGVLHDVVEDHGATLSQIEQRFGSEVSVLVGALSEDEAIESYEARKGALRAQVVAAGAEASLIFAADKLAKVRELRVRFGRARWQGEADPADGAAKLGHYAASLAALDGLIPASPIVRQLRFELEALDALPPGRRPLSRPAPARRPPGAQRTAVAPAGLPRLSG
ncbi:MAG: HD domain-containing protein [Solirubrobacteraceae bacterium]